METSATVVRPARHGDLGAVVALLNDLRWDDRQGAGPPPDETAGSAWP